MGTVDCDTADTTSSKIGRVRGSQNERWLVTTRGTHDFDRYAREPHHQLPYEEPTKHFVLGDNGPTGETADKRRPSEFFVPVPKAKKGSKQAESLQLSFDLNVTDEKVERNDAIDQLRDEVRHWRLTGYQRVTPISKKPPRVLGGPDAREPHPLCTA